MHLTRFILITFILSLVSSINAQSVKIGIWRDNKTTERFIFTSHNESVWKLDGKSITLAPNKSIYFTLESGKIRVSDANKVYGKCYKVALSETKLFNLHSLKPQRKEEIYTGQLLLSVTRKGLKVINKFNDIETYISGVVEAESGKDQNEEYYKVQATICRTFAMSNSRRHEDEGFNLCDRVHCQVYHGISRFNPLIVKVTEDTAGEVIVDSDINLITASFHSNCGGLTNNSEDVWSLALPYLRSVRDTFCTSGVHAHWTRRIPKVKWLNYFEKKKGSSLVPMDKKGLLSFYSKNRETYISSSSSRVLRKVIRKNWRLKSTFFNITQKGSDVILTGRGYGHGVGLCQEGAMEMSRRGYSYLDILRFYYTDIHLIHKSMTAFFKEE